MSLKQIIDFIFQEFVNYFKNDFSAKDIVIGVIAIIILGVLKSIVQKIKNKIAEKHNWCIDGIWYATFKSMRYPDRLIIEIYRIRQIGNKLKIKVQHFSSNRNSKVSLLKGNGIIRGTRVSFFYYTVKSNSLVSGIIKLDAIHTEADTFELHGNFFEDKNEPDIETDFLKLRSVKISLYNKLLLEIGMPAYKNYYKVKEKLKIND